MVFLRSTIFAIQRALSLPHEIKPMGGVRRAVLAGERNWLLARIGQAPDLTLQALRSELTAKGVQVSLWAVWKLFKSKGITFKKKPAA